MKQEFITVDVPLEDLARHYLKLTGFRQSFALRHLNIDAHDFHTVEVCDRIIGNELQLCFTLKNGGNTVREVIRSMDEIFNMMGTIKSLLLAKDENGKT